MKRVSLILTDRRVKSQLCYLFVANEVLEKSDDEIKTNFINEFSKYLSTWIECIALHTEDVSDLDAITQILSNFKHQLYLTTRFVDQLMSIYHLKVLPFLSFFKRKIISELKSPNPQAL